MKRSRPSRISPTGTADTSIFSVVFTSLGCEQPRVWYPAKLGTQRHLQAKEAELCRMPTCPRRERFGATVGSGAATSLPALGEQWCLEAEV